MTDGYHTPVLVEEVLKFLVTKPDGIYVDANLGGGGHSERILNKLLPTGVLVGIDADEDAVNFSKKRFGEKILTIHGNFSHLSQLLSEKDIFNIDGILFDLGVSSFQIDSPEKGFGFRMDSKLDFRFDKRQKLDAHTVINSYSEKQLADIFWKYGEEKFSRHIARKIISYRSSQVVETTGDLVEVIKSTVNNKFIQKTLARIFQAIRIEVNSELDSLRSGLSDAMNVLKPSSRIVVISYHSLEDRIVKDFFKDFSMHKIYSGHKLIPDKELIPFLKVLTKKPVTPNDDEINQNPRARSAKLRAAEKI